MNDAIRMQISAFVDGELPQNEAELLLRRLCQDRELRQQAADYLAMGRVIRGERIVTGMSSLRERIAAELGETEFDETVTDTAPETPRYLRPVAGVAIAAGVAMVALLGLQQMSGDPGIGGQDAPVTATANDGSYTVPSSQQDPLLDYQRRHNASVQFFDTQLVTYPLPEEQQSEEIQDSDESAAGETVEAPETVDP